MGCRTSGGGNGQTLVARCGVSGPALAGSARNTLAVAGRDAEFEGRIELAQYEVNGEARVLVGQRVNGVIRLSDHPASGHGRAYLVERGLERDGLDATDALLHDYLTQSERLQAVPMASGALAGTEPR